MLGKCMLCGKESAEYDVTYIPENPPLLPKGGVGKMCVGAICGECVCAPEMENRVLRVMHATIEHEPAGGPEAVQRINGFA